MNGTTARAFRVTTQLRIRVERIEAAQVPVVARGILAAAPPDLSKIDPELANWMLRIESKLDCLLATMGLPQHSSALAEAPVEIGLSEEGLTLCDADGFEVGAWVRIELDLPGPPLYRLVCIARALESEANEAGPGQGATPTHFGFEVLREEDRQALVAHILDVQRRELRRRSGMAGAR